MNRSLRKRICFGVTFTIAHLSTITLATAEETTPPKPLEPKIAAASNEPVQALAAIQVPEGMRGSLFAAEPDVANVVAFSIDDQGRFWVCETFRQSNGVTDNRGHDDEWLKADLAAKTVADRIDFHRRLLSEADAKKYEEQDDRIRLVEDTDGDHRADKATVFAAGFNRIEDGTGAGVLAHRGSVYYTCIPKLWRLIDRDQDGKADERIVMHDGYGVRVAFRGHDMHGLIVGPDGRLYFSIGDRGYHVTNEEGETFADPASGAVFRCELDGSKLEVFATGLRNPQELAFDQYGHLFTGDNNSDSGDKARFVNVVEGGDSGWRMYYQYLPDRGPFNREKIWYPFHPEQPAYIVPPIENVSDGPSGLVYYPGTGFGDTFDDTFLLADFRGTPAQSGIRAIQVEPSGAFYKLKKNEQSLWKVLATDLAFGPDGALYVSDWVDGWVGEGKGRIYRFESIAGNTAAEKAEVKKLLGQNWSEADLGVLADLLTHRDQRVRFNAQWELALRGAVKPLHATALDTTKPLLARLHAIWGTAHFARLNQAQLEAALEPLLPLLEDAEREVRGAVANAFGDLRYARATDALVKKIADPEPRVVYQATMASGKLHAQAAWEPIVEMLAQSNNTDPLLRHAGIFALAKLAADDAKLVQLKSHGSVAVRRAATVALRRRSSPQIAEFLGDADAAVVAEAARAIHDLPIAKAMPALADLARSPGNQDETTFRAMNACFRLGGAENAMTIAKIAGTHPSEKLRLEALEMLAMWGAPPERDRVINDWRPIESRDPNDALLALKANLGQILAGTSAVQAAGTKTAAKYGITEVVPALLSLYRDAKDELVRSSSLAALVTLDAKQAQALLPEALNDNAARVRIAALEASVKLTPEKAVGLLAQGTKSKVAAERQAAWRALGTVADRDETKKIMSQGIEAYLRGELASDVWLDVLDAAEKAIPAELATKLKAQQDKWIAEDPLNAWRWALAGGDVAAGKSLFFNKAELSCVRCHKVNSQGGEVGPELTATAQKRDAKYLLEAIVLPNAKIAEGYESIVLVDDSGSLFTGVLKRETPEFVELMLADGTLKRVDQETIEARRKGNSAMPADIEKHLSRRDLRDLVAYLSSLREAADKTKHE